MIDAERIERFRELIGEAKAKIAEAEALLTPSEAGGAQSAPAETSFNIHDGYWKTSAQAAYHWNVSTGTVERWRKDGMIRAQKIGGRWYHDIRYPPKKP